MTTAVIWQLQGVINLPLLCVIEIINFRSYPSQIPVDVVLGGFTWVPVVRTYPHHLFRTDWFCDHNQNSAVTSSNGISFGIHTGGCKTYPIFTELRSTACDLKRNSMIEARRSLCSFGCNYNPFETPTRGPLLQSGWQNMNQEFSWYKA